MCHLAIEKMLKAIYSEVRLVHPPKTHDLLFLIREIGLSIPKTHLDFLGIVNNASIPTRYPDYLKLFVSQYNRRRASSYLAKTKKVIKWLRKDPRLAMK